MVGPVLAFPGDSWTTRTPMPTARYGHAAAVVDGKIFVLGGYKEGSGFLGTNEMYDPLTDTWTTKFPMPTPRRFFAIAVFQNKIYVVGGEIPHPFYPQVYVGASSETEVYDPSTDSWERKTPMPTPRAKLSAQVVNDRIYLIGGFNPDPYTPYGYRQDKNEVYDPQDDQWTTKAPLPTPVDSYCSAVVHGKIYILGGRSSTPSGNPVSSLNQIYDPSMNIWDYGKNMIQGICSAASSAATGPWDQTAIYVMGGNTEGSDNPNSVSNRNQAYIPESDVWIDRRSMPTARDQLALAAVNDTIYAIGGRSSEGIVLTKNEMYTAFIPEFPSFVILPLFMIAALLAIIVHRRKHIPQKHTAEKTS